MARCFGASIALSVFWQLVTGFSSRDFEPAVGMAEFNYTTYLPDYLYPPAEYQWNPGQWNYVYPPAEFEWNPGQYLPMCEVCPQVQPQAGDEGPTLLRADETESLVEMDDGEVEIILEEVVESKENVMHQQQRPREKMSGRFGAPLSELELNAMSTPFVPQSTKCATSWSVNLFKAWVNQRNERTGGTYPEDLLETCLDPKVLEQCLAYFVVEGTRNTKGEP